MKKTKKTKKEDLLDIFLRDHQTHILYDITGAPDAERACDTFPADRLARFLDIVNSGILIALWLEYKAELLDIIIDRLNLDKYKITVEDLKKKIVKKKKK